MKKAACLALTLLLFAGPAFAGPPDLSLDDLGFTPQQTAGDAQKQILFEKRTRMLKTHQILGLTALAPMTAALITSGRAGYGNSKSARNLHAALGSATGALYFSSAYYAWRAPALESAKPSGASKVHRALAFVHFPAMILTPIAAIQAKKQLDRGEEPRGFAKQHRTFATVAAAAYGASMLVLVFNF
jgi:hypothetical protein